jgi:hypothetical protein
MVNARRGDVDAVIDGRVRTLRLTLGALAELEAAFGAQDLVALAARFESGRLSAGDIMRVIGAGLRGAGADDSDEDVGRMAIDGGLAGAARLVARLFAAALGDDEPAREEGARTPRPPRAPQRG